MKVMVLGSGGMIGRAVCRALTGRGHHVVAVTRGAALASEERQTHVQADRSNAPSILSAIKAHRIDALVDMIAYGEPETRALLNAISIALARYVLISSADVYRNYGLLHQRETGAPDPGLLVEDAPLRASRFPYRGASQREQSDPARWMDDYDKIPIEETVRKTMPRATILRLPMVFGDGDKQTRFQWALRPILSGAERATISAAWLRWTSTYAHVSNIADGVAHAVSAPKAEGRTFNLTDFPPVSHRDWVDRFTRTARWSGQFIESTDPADPIARATAGLDLTVPLLVSGEVFVRECAWKPPMSLDIIVSSMTAARAN
jgi:nucleoside-diphosphate-sugar epimerase